MHTRGAAILMALMRGCECRKWRWGAVCTLLFWRKAEMQSYGNGGLLSIAHLTIHAGSLCNLLQPRVGVTRPQHY